MILSRFKVSGHSMFPTLREGQNLIVSSLPYLFKNPKIGDIVVAKTDRLVVKKVKRIAGDKIYIGGERGHKDFKITKESLIGKVILCKL